MEKNCKNHSANDCIANNNYIQKKLAARKNSCGPTASSMDFVSADVNEVLQDAREILTNRERREDHPNESVLDESTTVKFTKTGGDEDPMEVTVLRRRLVKRREEPESGDQEERGFLFC